MTLVLRIGIDGEAVPRRPSGDDDIAERMSMIARAPARVRQTYRNAADGANNAGRLRVQHDGTLPNFKAC